MKTFEDYLAICLMTITFVVSLLGLSYAVWSSCTRNDFTEVVNVCAEGEYSLHYDKCFTSKPVGCLGETKIPLGVFYIVPPDGIDAGESIDLKGRLIEGNSYRLYEKQSLWSTTYFIECTEVK